MLTTIPGLVTGLSNFPVSLCYAWSSVQCCGYISFYIILPLMYITYVNPNLWWLIFAMSYQRVFGAKTRKGATWKPAKWWLFRVFAWRLFALPHESTWHSMRCIFGYCLSYLCLAGRKVAMQKPAKITIWRVLHGNLSRFRPENPLIWHGTNQPPYKSDIPWQLNLYT